MASFAVLLSGLGILGLIAFILLIIVIFVIVLIVNHNKLIRLKEQVSNEWSQIDVELQRRFDLIPNLINTVKGYMTHEKKTLTEIAEVRTRWAEAKSVADKIKVSKELDSYINSLVAVAESNPNLKSSDNFIQLQSELSNTESRIANTRTAYNNSVTSYNTAVKVFPSNIVASMFKFTPAELFEVSDVKAHEAVKVDFN